MKRVPIFESDSPQEVKMFMLGLKLMNIRGRIEEGKRTRYAVYDVTEPAFALWKAYFFRVVRDERAFKEPT